jgi:CRISPR/Cas system-associated exonuclease Cas4 (RecB family)
MMKSFARWAKTINGDIHDTELKVISRQHKYSGTLDAVGTFNGKPMLYDWKTSSRIYPDMDLQLVAYAQAYKEQTGIELKQGMIVHVSKDKPHFKLTTKVFRLGKRPLKKFLKLRETFDDMMTKAEA